MTSPSAMWARAACSALVISAVASAQAGSFPDDWYYSGVTKLRQLEGKPAPKLSIAEWRGDEVALADQRGKVVVVDFWATWCGPCMAAIPKNVDLVASHPDDLVFVGLHDSSRGWDKVDQVISDKGINYSVGVDDGGASVKAYSLSFWPTYVVIDKKGVVRGAGLTPDKVKDAALQLLAEDGPAPASASKKDAAAAEFSDDWFLGGAKRSPAFRAVERKPVPALRTAVWSGTELDPAGRDVVVYQFVRPELSMTLKPLSALAEVSARYASQGVAFVLVCDARSDFDRMTEVATAMELSLAIAHDTHPRPNDAEEGGAEGGDTEKGDTEKADETKPTEPVPGPGVFATALGVRFQPATVVVDRAGVVRAAGLKTAHLEEVLNTLLAEPMPAPKKADPERGEESQR